MLILSRKIKEAVIIGDAIEVKVVGATDDVVKLAISAPKDVSILRKEIFESTKESNQSAVISRLDSINSRDLLSAAKRPENL